MVQGLVALFHLVVFEHGKVGDPHKVKPVVVDEPQLFAQVVAQVSQGLVGDFGLVRHKKDQIAGGHVDPFGQAGLLLVGEEFGDGGLPGIFAHLDPRQALGPVNGHERSQVIDLFA